MLTFRSYLKKVYHDISKEVVKSWITPDKEFGRGILRRLDYAYGFDQENGNPMQIKNEDVNPLGLLHILERYHDVDEDEQIRALVEQVREDCETIKDLHYKFLVADYEKFNKKTTKFLNDIFISLDFYGNVLTTTLPAQTIIYRMRKIDKPEHPNDSRIEFFHVPFSKRYLMGTYRYSIPGYPSLYGSSTLYGCWEEMGREDVTEYGYAALKTTNAIQFLDLRWRFDSELTANEDQLAAYILRLPIIIACSMQVQHAADKFVPEYIFPQQIFQWLISKLRKDTKNKARTTLGVIYSSTKHDVWEALCSNEIKIDEVTNYALLAYISPDDITQYSETLAKKLNVQVPQWIDKHVSAKKSPYQILTSIQTELSTTHLTYWKNMSQYIGDNRI